MEKNNNRLLLIDGSALLHRAYHAMPGLTDRQGRPTGAVYGFVRMLLRAMKDLQPNYVAVAFDRKEQTFRKEMFIGYQSQRPELDEELSEQFGRVRELLKALEVSVYDKAGFEADDILGTISKLVTEGNSKSQIRISKQYVNSNSKQNSQRSDVESQFLVSEVIVLTSDKDLMQLVNDQVKLYLPIKGVTEAELVGSEGVKEKLGVLPGLVVDYKGLVGDASDNYPGVKGIGPKTAVMLLDAYGGFEGVYKHLNEIKESVKNKLIDGEEAGKLSKKLAKICRDVEIDFDLKACETVVKNPGKLARVLDGFGFTSLAKQMGLDEQVGGEQMKLV